MIMLPILTIYSDLTGVLRDWVISTKFLNVADQPYWAYAAQGVDTWQIMEGVFKSFFFGGAIWLMYCYKGITCWAGAFSARPASFEDVVPTLYANLKPHCVLTPLLHAL